MIIPSTFNSLHFPVYVTENQELLQGNWKAISCGYLLYGTYMILTQLKEGKRKMYLWLNLREF